MIPSLPSAIAITRVSGLLQEASLETQRASLLKTAAHNGHALDPASVFSDEDV